MGEVVSSLKDQGKAILIMLAVGVISILGMIVMGAMRPVINTAVSGNTALNNTIQALVTAFVAAFAFVGTFAGVTMIIVVLKAVIGIVKGLQGN